MLPLAMQQHLRAPRCCRHYCISVLLTPLLLLLLAHAAILLLPLQIIFILLTSLLCIKSHGTVMMLLPSPLHHCAVCSCCRQRDAVAIDSALLYTHDTTALPMTMTLLLLIVYGHHRLIVAF